MAISPPSLRPTAGVRSQPAEPCVPATSRIASLDAFRGLTIAAMILVNNPGTAKAVYGPLRHAEWNGCTPADLIFPFFLFIMGVSLACSLDRRQARDGRGKVLGHILWRSVVLFALGLLLNGLFYLPWAEVRIPGVLQRIGVVYFFAAVIVLTTTRRMRIALTVGALLGYWLLLTRVPVPGHGIGDLSPAGNLASYVDRRLFAGHLWRPEWDPEGVISTVPAIATALLGTLASEWIRSTRARTVVAAGMLTTGMAGVLIGALWGWGFPINKSLWTSSYAVFTAGLALFGLGACYWLMDVKQWRAWAMPLVAFGVNPLALFVGSEVVGSLLYLLRWPATQASAKHALLAKIFLGWAAPVNASLLWALAYVAVWWVVAWVLYHRAIYIKL